MKLTCEGCQKIHELPRTPEIPKHVVSMCCNWCLNCEDSATEYYREWYNESDGGNKAPKPTPVAANQLCMPFELDLVTDEEIEKRRVTSYQYVKLDEN